MTVIEPPALQRDDVVVRGGGFTIEDRDALPADGRRHELLDGVLILSPAPRTRHQDVVVNLAVLLKEALPPELKVVVAPFDVRRGADTAIQPDLVVARRGDVSPEGFTTRPLLAVEVASPSTRWIDLGRKRDLLAEMRCPHYWTVEPHGDDDLPEVTLWHLVDGAFVERAVVRGRESLEVATPVVLTLTPADLLDE
ncbi:Uma2 family endonuclease [Nocardioides nanhaiensis]